MSAYSKPIVVDGDGTSAVMLERLPLGLGNEGLFSEKWLQDALYKNPECLPIKEIDPHIGRLIPICTELETGSGPADILYVTATGRLVLIETKLWRNPQARREVVGQILDYAKQLTSWSYEELAKQAAIATGKGADYLLSCLELPDRNSEEAKIFVDGINRSLKAGDFLLIIVGDGIRSGAEALVGFLEQYGNLRFSLNLVEVAAFRLPNNQVLLQPRILAKTKVLIRTVLMGPSGPLEFEQVASVEDATSKNDSQAAWFQVYWAEYLSKLHLDDLSQPVPASPARSTNIFFSMPPGGGSAWISAYIAQSSGKGGVYLSFSKAFEKVGEYYEGLLSQREEIEKILGMQLTWERNGDKVYISAANISFSNLNEPNDRQRVLEYLADMTNRFINVFRHRLDALGHESA
jgi:hypothetical protein